MKTKPGSWIEQLALIPGLSIDCNWLKVGRETSCNTLNLATVTHRHFSEMPRGLGSWALHQVSLSHLGSLKPLQQVELWCLSCSAVHSFVPLHPFHLSSNPIFNFSSASIMALLEVDHDFLIVFSALSFHTPIRSEMLSSCTFSSHTIRGCTAKQGCLVTETFPVLKR